jgi:hypothetical protein
VRGERGRPPGSRPGRRLLGLVLAVAGALFVAACGSKPAATAPSRAPAAVIVVPTLATSVSSSGGATWAVVDMGGAASAYENFWELFVRPPGASGWKLATPTGVASNGGLVMTAAGATTLVTGFRPSQDLTFSPLASTTDAGTQWSQTAPLSPGLGDGPDALAGSASGQLIALTDSGDVETSTSLGATWARLTTQRSLAASEAGRACGLQELTGAAWTRAGLPLIAGRCGKPGVAGIFEYSAGTWRLIGPALPGALSGAAINVLGLASTGARTTALLAVTAHAGTSVLAAWSANGGTDWQLSPALAAGRTSTASVSIWGDGSAGVVLAPGSPRTGATIGWQAASWQTLPTLPAGTATLAIGSGGEPEALAVNKATMTAWQLPAGSSQWTLAQTLPVTIPYGSSS